VNDTSLSVRGPVVGKGELELSGETGTLYLAGSTGGRLKFEGPTNDIRQLEITAQDPTVTQTQQFPDATGAIQVVPATTMNAGTLMWGHANDDAADSGNEVCALAGLICVRARSLAGVESDCTVEFTGMNRFFAFCRS
jgi:hypothetical protein